MHTVINEDAVGIVINHSYDTKVVYSAMGGEILRSQYFSFS